MAVTVEGVETRELTEALGGGPPDPPPVARAVAYSRYPLYLLFLVYAINTADRQVISVLFPPLKEEFHLSDSALGILSGTFVAVVAVSAVPFGVIADRWVRTKLIAWGMIAWSLAEVWVGRAGSFGTLFASRTALGVGEATFQPAAYSLLADYYEAEDRGKIYGILQIGAVVGAVSIVFGGAIADQWGWRAVMYAFAAPGFVLAFFVARLPEPPRGYADLRQAGVEGGGGTTRQKVTNRKAYGEILRIPTVSITLLGNGISHFMTSGVAIWLPTFMVRHHDMSLTKAAALLGATQLIGGVAGMLGGGMLGDYLMRRGQRSGRLMIAAIGQIAAAVFLAGAFATGSTPMFLILFCFGVVAATAPTAPLIAARADVTHPDLRGRLAALQGLTFAAAGALSPAIVGGLSDAYSLRIAFLLVMPAMAVGGVIMWVLGPRYVSRDIDRMRTQLVEERGGEAPAAV